MTHEQMRITEQATKEMKRRFPQEELDYRNRVVGTAIGLGKKEKITEDWIRKGLIEDILDGFITYGQVIYIKDEYFKAIREVVAMF